MLCWAALGSHIESIRPAHIDAGTTHLTSRRIFDPGVDDGRKIDNHPDPHQGRTKDQ